jgi:O-antigen ligase
LTRLWSHLRSSPEAPGSYAGIVWILAVGALFFYFSNPLSMVPFFGDSLQRSIHIATAATVLTLPWLRVPRLPWAVLPVIALMYASLEWTITWDVTWGVTLVYVKVALVAWVCTWSTDVRTLAHGLHLGGVVVVVTSIYAFWAGLPFAAVPEDATGFLAGVGANRNILGYTLVPAWAAALAHVPAGRLSRSVWGVGVTTIALGLFLAQSATAFVVAALVAILAFALSRRDRLRERVGSRRIVAAVGGGAAALGVLVVVALLLGRDLGTLSGRTRIWSAIWDATYGQRLLGQGWGTTWPHAWVQAPPNPVYEYVNANYGAGAIAHGHSTLMDVMPDLGVAGMIAFTLAYAAVALLAVRRWWRMPSGSGTDPSGPLAILVLLALVAYGLTEPLGTTPLGWFLIVMLAALVARPTISPIAAPDPATSESADPDSDGNRGLAGRHRHVRG